MHALSPFRIGTSSPEYCSQAQESVPPPIQTIEEGVQRIEKLLAKEILCKHDVDQINQTYKAIDLLERQVDPIPERNTKHILQLIINKVDAIFQKKTISAQDWISFYHLQGFSDPQLKLRERFTQLEPKPSEVMDPIALATHLPCCASESQFNKDIQALIGADLLSGAARLLNRKKDALKQHEQLKIEIAEAKEALQKCRQTNPQQYPPYLDELLEGGYIHLYNHLLEMSQLSDRNVRVSALEKISFSSLSHIILETREAILRKTERCIPKDAQNVLFLLGGSGAGKSTTLCFLRGDPMVLKSFQYESSNDKDQIIGHASAISCTFLPTVEVVKDWVIVDFPGFEDSNGPLIALGMEFALKALLAKYNSKILVVESITNIEGRFATAAGLGRRLDRLIGNKRDCHLGITKYSKDPDYARLKAIEELQKKELDSPSVEEQVLEGQIQALVSVNLPQLKPQIELFQQKLDAIRQQKKEQQQLPLPETEEKREIRNRLQEREAELLKQVGLGNIIRFDELDDPNRLASCFETFAMQMQSARPCSEQVLDPAHEKQLDEWFEKKLKVELANQKEYTQVKDFREFEQRVLESSLISTIFGTTHPEIGQFLHVPEMSPKLVRKYDQAIVKSCIDKCIAAATQELNMALLEKILKEVKGTAPSSLVKDLQEKSERLRDYIMGLLGELPEDHAKANEAWLRIQKEQKSAIDAIEKDFTLSSLATVLMCLPIGVPYGIRTLYKWNQQSNKTAELIKTLLEECCGEVDQIQQTLIRLKDLEKIIAKQEEIDKAFNSVAISLESEEVLIQSMKDKILAVRGAYGAEEWDKRVRLLGKEIDFFPPSNLAMIAPLIDKGITYLEKDHLDNISDLTNEAWKTDAIEIQTAPFLEFNNFLLAHEQDKYLVCTKYWSTRMESKIKNQSSFSNAIQSTLMLSTAVIIASGFFVIGRSQNSPTLSLPEFIKRTKELTDGKINMKNNLFRAMVADALFKAFERAKPS